MKKDASQSSTRNLKEGVPGVWQLKSRIDLDSSGQRHIDPILGADPLGILCFSGNHFAAQFMKRDRTETAPIPQATAGANNSNAINGYDAYFGTYSLDESTGALIVRLEGAISPDDIGGEFERNIDVHDDELRITLATTSVDGVPVTRTLTFTRLK